MTTDKQRDANKKNAQKSTGPKSAEGKTMVRSNAVTHGLYVKDPESLTGMIQLRYLEILDNLKAEHHPLGSEENNLLETIAQCNWHLERLEFYSWKIPDEISGTPPPPEAESTLDERLDFWCQVSLGAFHSNSRGRQCLRLMRELRKDRNHAYEDFRELQDMRARRKNYRKMAAEMGVDSLPEWTPMTPEEEKLACSILMWSMHMRMGTQAEQLKHDERLIRETAKIGFDLLSDPDAKMREGDQVLKSHIIKKTIEGALGSPKPKRAKKKKKLRQKRRRN